MSGLGRSPLPHLPKNAAALRREMGFSDEEIQRFLKKKWHHEAVGNLGQGGDRWYGRVDPQPPPSKILVSHTTKNWLGFRPVYQNCRSPATQVLHRGSNPSPRPGQGIKMRFYPHLNHTKSVATPLCGLNEMQSAQENTMKPSTFERRTHAQRGFRYPNPPSHCHKVPILIFVTSSKME